MERATSTARSRTLCTTSKRVHTSTESAGNGADTHPAGHSREMTAGRNDNERFDLRYQTIPRRESS